MGIGTFIGWSFWVFFILTIFAKARWEHFKFYRLPESADTTLNENNKLWQESKLHWWDAMQFAFGALTAYCFITYMIFI